MIYTDCKLWPESLYRPGALFQGKAIRPFQVEFYEIDSPQAQLSYQTVYGGTRESSGPIGTTIGAHDSIIDDWLDLYLVSLDYKIYSSIIVH